MSKRDDFQVLPFPRLRRFATDLGYMARHKHTIRGLVEVDVTKPRQYIREHKAQTGEALSFTAFLAHCVGAAVDVDKSVHGYQDWRGRLVIFDDVDITVTVEVETATERFLTGHIVRAANRKNVAAIHNEIRSAQGQSLPRAAKETRLLALFTILPGPLRRVLLWIIWNNPRFSKQVRGTVALASVGMFGTRGGWGISAPSHTLGIVVGGIAQKPTLVDGRLELHEHLCLTLEFDHDIVDGAPAARFTQRVIELIESGHGLLAQAPT